MIALTMEIVGKGPVAVFYSRKPTIFGNETELRWLPYYNSRAWCLKTEYNVSDEEDEAIRQFI